MRSLRVVVLVLGVAMGAGCARDRVAAGGSAAAGGGGQGRAAAVDARSGIVRIEPVLADGGTGEALDGVVTPHGRVLTAMTAAIQKASGARIVTSTGESFDATGVAGYLSARYIVLLEADWRDRGPPRALPWAERQARSGAKLTIVGAGDGRAEGGTPERREVVLDTQKSTTTMRLMGPGSPGWALEGAPVLDSESRVVGLINGFDFGVSIGLDVLSAGPKTTSALRATPVETLAATPSGRILNWEEWRALQPKLREAEGIRDEARKLARRGELDDAIQRLRRSLSLDDRSAGAWRLLGDAYWRQKEYGKSAEAFGKVLELEPTDVDAGHWRVRCLTELKRYAEALGVTERLVALAPWRADMQNEYGAALWWNRRFLEARAAFERALELDPKNEYAKKSRARLNEILEAR